MCRSACPAAAAPCSRPAGDRGRSAPESGTAEGAPHQPPATLAAGRLHLRSPSSLLGKPVWDWSGHGICTQEISFVLQQLLEQLSRWILQVLQAEEGLVVSTLSRMRPPHIPLHSQRKICASHTLACFPGGSWQLQGLGCWVGVSLHKTRVTQMTEGWLLLLLLLLLCDLEEFLQAPSL